MSRKVNSVVAKPREVQLSRSMQFAPALCVLLDPCFHTRSDGFLYPKNLLLFFFLFRDVAVPKMMDNSS